METRLLYLSAVLPHRDNMTRGKLFLSSRDMPRKDWFFSYPDLPRIKLDEIVWGVNVWKTSNMQFKSFNFDYVLRSRTEPASAWNGFLFQNLSSFFDLLFVFVYGKRLRLVGTW